MVLSMEDVAMQLGMQGLKLTEVAALECAASENTGLDPGPPRMS
jgi:hypothetical protein